MDTRIYDDSCPRFSSPRGFRRMLLAFKSHRAHTFWKKEGHRPDRSRRQLAKAGRHRIVVKTAAETIKNRDRRKPLIRKSRRGIIDRPKGREDFLPGPFPWKGVPKN